MADLNVNSIANSAGTGAPDFPNGINQLNSLVQMRTTSSRSTEYGLIRTDSGSVNPLVELKMLGTGTFGYLGSFVISTTQSDAYNSPCSEVARFTSSGLSFDGGANSLDDYDEDVWTPGIQLGTATGHTYSVRTGTYTKIGRTVTASFTIQMTAKDAASSNDMYITGLPFSAINVSFGANWAQQFGITVGSPYTSYIGHSSGTSIRLLRVSNGSYDIIQNSEVGSNVTLKGSMNFDV